jgi:uncharacterized damage-inducible protein DinB
MMISIFTNPASRSIPDARAYTAAVLNLLGKQDPMHVLRETPAVLRSALVGLSGTQLAQPEAAGKWSIRQVLQHLADSELVWAYRLRLVLAQDRPPLTGYDQDAWAHRLHYDEADVATAVDEFGALRRANLRLLARASPDDLARVGVHAERGEESVGHMVRLYAGHDLLHLAQVARVREAVTA